MASKKHRDKIVRHGSYNILKKNAHLLRKKAREKLRQITKTINKRPRTPLGE